MTSSHSPTSETGASQDVTERLAERLRVLGIEPEESGKGLFLCVRELVENAIRAVSPGTATQSHVVEVALTEQHLGAGSTIFNVSVSDDGCGFGGWWHGVPCASSARPIGRGLEMCLLWADISLPTGRGEGNPLTVITTTRESPSISRRSVCIHPNGGFAASPVQRMPKEGASFAGSRVSVALIGSRAGVDELHTYLSRAARLLFAPSNVLVKVSLPAHEPLAIAIAPLPVHQLLTDGVATPVLEHAVTVLAQDAADSTVHEPGCVISLGEGHAPLGISDGFCHATTAIAAVPDALLGRGARRPPPEGHAVLLLNNVRVRWQSTHQPTSAVYSRWAAGPRPSTCHTSTCHMPTSASTCAGRAGVEKARAWRAALSSKNLHGAWLCVHVRGAGLAFTDAHKSSIAPAPRVKLSAAIAKAVDLAVARATQRCAEDHGIYVDKTAHEEHATRQLAARIVRALQEMTSSLEDEAGASGSACHVDAAREASEERRLGALLADSLRR